MSSDKAEESGAALLPRSLLFPPDLQGHRKSRLRINLKINKQNLPLILGKHCINLHGVKPLTSAITRQNDWNEHKWSTRQRDTWQLASVRCVVLLACFPVTKMGLSVHIGHAGNEYRFTRLPTRWQSQINHLALLRNTDHRNHRRAAFTARR